MKLNYRHMAIFSIVIFCLVMPCLILIFSGTATPFITCFAVDSLDRVYVGAQNEIRIYENDLLIGTINPKTSRSYMFTINEDENIVLSTASKVYTLDLQGNILDVQDDPGADMYNQIQHKKRKFLSAKGDNYELVGELGWSRIVKNNNETVFQISLLSFIVKILIALCIILLFAIPLWALISQRGQGDGSVVPSNEGPQT